MLAIHSNDVHAFRWKKYEAYFPPRKKPGKPAAQPLRFCFQFGFANCFFNTFNRSFIHKNITLHNITLHYFT